jgi:hypothetical protein
MTIRSRHGFDLSSLSAIERRSFLKAGAATGALGIFGHSRLGASGRPSLPCPRTLTSLAGDRLTHVFRDL